jgi:hypothetical protein
MLMIQIVIWMLCVYLVLKGKELELIASASSHENREHNMDHARRWAILAYIAAIGFFILSLMQGSAIPDPPSSLGYP